MSNLPPGCSQADVDRAMGADEWPDECPTCGSSESECRQIGVDFRMLTRERDALKAQRDALLEAAKIALREGRHSAECLPNRELNKRLKRRYCDCWKSVLALAIAKAEGEKT